MYGDFFVGAEDVAEAAQISPSVAYDLQLRRCAALGFCALCGFAERRKPPVDLVAGTIGANFLKRSI